MSIAELRSEHAQAVVAHQAAQQAYSAVHTRLQMEESPHEKLSLQARLIDLNRQCTSALQIVGLRAAKLKTAERTLLQLVKRQLVNEYKQQADALALTLSTLMRADEALGISNYDCAGLGGFRLPGYADQKCNDMGAIWCAQDLESLRPQAQAKLDAMMHPPVVDRTPVQPHIEPTNSNVLGGERIGAPS